MSMNLAGRSVAHACRGPASRAKPAIAALFALCAAFQLSLPLAGEAIAADNPASTKQVALRGMVLPAGAAGTHDSLAATNFTTPRRSGAKRGFLPRLNFSNYRYDLAPKVRLASLHPAALPKPRRQDNLRVSERAAIDWLASPRCLPKQLKEVLGRLAARYGKVTVTSTHRNKYHNRRVGGAPHSFHLKCQAIDFRINRNYRATLAFLRRQAKVGGLKHYGDGLFHIDTGRRRSW